MDDESFVRSSELFVVAAEATEVGISELFNQIDDQSSSSLASIEQRSMLYFGG